MTDVSALTDLPTPANTDYLLSWRGSAPYRLALSQIPYRNSNGVMVLSQVFAPNDGDYYGLGASFYTGQWRNSVTGQGGSAIRNSSGVMTFLTGTNPGTAGSAFTDFAERARIDNVGNFSVGTTGGDFGRSIRGAFRRDQNAITEVTVLNGSVGASAVAQFSRIGGTGNNFADWKLSDNSGAPYDLLSYGSAVQFSSIQFGGIERYRFTNGGNFGVGVVSPSFPIDTIGLVNIRGNGLSSAVRFQNTTAGRDMRIMQKDAGYVAITDETGGAEIFSASFLGGFVAPGGDNTYSCGRSSTRFTVVYAVSGTINTSDEREKLWRGELNEDELKAAKRIANEIGVYQWLDAIEQKGEDGARLHIGVRAQRVFKILEECGLDWQRYAWCCYDKWEDEFETIYDIRKITVIDKVLIEENTSIVNVEGNSIKKVVEREVEETYDTGEKKLKIAAGDRYGVRPDQLAMFLIAAQEQRLAAIEDRYSDGK